MLWVNIWFLITYISKRFWSPYLIFNDASIYWKCKTILTEAGVQCTRMSPGWWSAGIVAVFTVLPHSSSPHHEPHASLLLGQWRRCARAWRGRRCRFICSSRTAAAARFISLALLQLLASVTSSGLVACTHTTASVYLCKVKHPAPVQLFIFLYKLALELINPLAVLPYFLEFWQYYRWQILLMTNITYYKYDKCSTQTSKVPLVRCSYTEGKDYIIAACGLWTVSGVHYTRQQAADEYQKTRECCVQRLGGQMSPASTRRVAMADMTSFLISAGTFNNSYFACSQQPQMSDFFLLVFTAKAHTHTLTVE